MKKIALAVLLAAVSMTAFARGGAGGNGGGNGGGPVGNGYHGFCTGDCKPAQKSRHDAKPDPKLYKGRK
ncbi:hypothetical protein SB778_03970 [Paraburkholderia sp. SIMBA_050]